MNGWESDENMHLYLGEMEGEPAPPFFPPFLGEMEGDFFVW